MSTKYMTIKNSITAQSESGDLEAIAALDDRDVLQYKDQEWVKIIKAFSLPFSHPHCSKTC